MLGIGKDTEGDCRGLC